VRYLDANIILRYLTRDDPAKADACFALLERVRAGTEEVFLTESVFTEIGYILSSRRHYALSHADVYSRLAPVLLLRGLRAHHKPVLDRALQLYAETPRLDIEDALIVAHTESGGASELYSYDGDFDGMPSVTRLEPGQAVRRHGPR
jgi:predicted nucleic acid-binding protein